MENHLDPFIGKTFAFNNNRKPFKVIRLVYGSTNMYVCKRLRGRGGFDINVELLKTLKEL